MDILLLKERIKQTIELGESQFREFKSAKEGPKNSKQPRDYKSIAVNISKTLVAFANADGGELLVGVEDDGQITGVDYRDETITKLLEAPVTHVHPQTPLSSPVARAIEIDEKTILYFSIEKSTRIIHQTSDGKCLQRKDLESVPVSATMLQFERQEQISREYDRQFVDGAQVTDLNLDILKKVAEHTTRMSPEKSLQYLGLAEYGMGLLRLRRAAVLLFAQDVTRWHPRSQVRVVRIRGTELQTGRDYNVLSDEIASGNILELIISAWDRLRPHLVETKMTPDALFKERVMYPEDACREALINAITHRDYSLEGQNIQILIFDDRMEVQSPGNLLSTIRVKDLEELQGVHESRNALVARVLREIGYVREIGEGMRRIFYLMQDADLVPPELYSEPGRFNIILHHKSVFSEADQRWLDGFKPLKLTREEMTIALMGKNGSLISPQGIYERLNLVDWDVYRKVIDQIQTKGVLYNALSEYEKQKIAKAKKISKRKVERLTIRQPDELEHALEEIFVVIQGTTPTTSINRTFYVSVLDKLSTRNPYKTNVSQISKLFRLIGLIDDNKNPTSLMINLWRKDVRLDKSEPKRRSYKQTIEAQDIYVGNLDYSTTRDELISFFEKCGTVIDVTLPMDYTFGNGRGFGFVKMSNQEEAETAIEQLNGEMVRDRVLHLSWAKSRN